MSQIKQGMYKMIMKSGSRIQKMAVIRATAFLIYTHTHTHSLQNMSYLPAYVCTIYGALGRATERGREERGLNMHRGCFFWDRVGESRGDREGRHKHRKHS